MRKNCTEEIEKELLENYQKYYRLAYSYVKNESDALDIVQESAYKAVKESRKIKEKSYISTWIYRIVINTAVDFLRKEKKAAESHERLEREAVGFYEDTTKNLDVMELLWELDERDRTVIILRYFEDMKLERIAEVTGEALSTIKSRLYRALKKLRLELESTG